jgi:hypothetical protein
MNEQTPNPSVPPLIPPGSQPATPPPGTPRAPSIGALPDDCVPIHGPFAAIEAMLRHPRRMFWNLRGPGAGKIIGGLFAIAAGCALVYGFVVGTFAGGEQLWAAPAKIAGGMLAAALICLPSLYIFSCLSGSQARLAEVFGLVAGMLGLTTILLIGFAPVAWLFSQSTSSIVAMGVLHLLFWGVATFFGWNFLRQGFANLSAHSSGGLLVWMGIFLLVCLQMTTALRPIIGTSDTLLPTEKKFFLAHWFDVMDQGGRGMRK